jgi:GNAT superfamily N-acetyltransferase
VSDDTMIGPATADDLRTLATALATQALFTAYGSDANALSTSWQRAFEQGQTFMVARDASGPKGLCWFSATGAFGRGAYLRLIAVVDSAQGSGLGARLLEAFEVECVRPAGGWFLLTSDFNTGAQRFYERHGYRCIGEIPGFVKPHIAERIYWKPRVL